MQALNSKIDGMARMMAIEMANLIHTVREAAGQNLGRQAEPEVLTKCVMADDEMRKSDDIRGHLSSL